MNGEPESLETGRKGKRAGRKEGKQEKMCPGQAKASPNESELPERAGEDSAENRVRKDKTETDLPPQSCSPLAVVMA